MTAFPTSKPRTFIEKDKSPSSCRFLGWSVASLSHNGVDEPRLTGSLTSTSWSAIQSRTLMLMHLLLDVRSGKRSWKKISVISLSKYQTPVLTTSVQSPHLPLLPKSPLGFSPPQPLCQSVSLISIVIIAFVAGVCFLVVSPIIYPNWFWTLASLRYRVFLIIELFSSVVFPLPKSLVEISHHSHQSPASEFSVCCSGTTLPLVGPHLILLDVSCLRGVFE